MDTKVDWIIHYVFDDPGPYPYLCNAHTHGNSINGMEKYHHLDFQMVLNLPQEHICYLLNTLGRRVQTVRPSMTETWYPACTRTAAYV